MKGLLITLIILLAPTLPLIGSYMMLTEYYGAHGINIDQWLSLSEMVGPCTDYFIEIFYIILILTMTSMTILWILELSVGYIGKAKSQSQKNKLRRITIAVVFIRYSVMVWGTLSSDATSISSLETWWIVLLYALVLIISFGLIFLIRKALPDIARVINRDITLERKIYLLLLSYPVVIFLCYSKIFGMVMSAKAERVKNYYHVETIDSVSYDSLILLGKSQKGFFFVRRGKSVDKNVTHIIQIEHIRKMKNRHFEFH